ncbi:hypothetical protein Q9966_016127 [Columba livia]|nr:hypothetical protein Q9966_016127 [Columba livia]
MSGGEVVCSGWLRKSPPEKKLRRYAWKKRWFVLRSGRMSGDPDVLEYYKNDHSKKPLRVINLNFCEQVDAGLTFNKKELQDSYIFDIKTSDRTFYLVAETEDDMNKWVRSICQICGFNQSEENTAHLEANLSLGSQYNALRQVMSKVTVELSLAHGVDGADLAEFSPFCPDQFLKANGNKQQKLERKSSTAQCGFCPHPSAPLKRRMQLWPDHRRPYLQGSLDQLALASMVWAPRGISCHSGMPNKPVTFTANIDGNTGI